MLCFASQIIYFVRNGEGIMLLAIYLDQLSTLTVLLLNWVLSPRCVNNFVFPNLLSFPKHRPLWFGNTNVTLFLQNFSHYIFFMSSFPETLVSLLLLMFNEACSWNWRPKRASLTTLSRAVNLYVYLYKEPKDLVWEKDVVLVLSCEMTGLI